MNLIKKDNNIRQNYIYNTAYQVLSLLTPLITAPYIAHVLDVDIIGKYSFTQSIVVYFCLVAAIGSGTYGQRGVAGLRNNKQKLSVFFYEVVILKWLTTIVSLLLFLIYINIFGREYFILFLIQGLNILSIGLDINWFYQGLENFKLTVTRQIFVKLFGLIAILLFIKSDSDLYLYVFFYAFPGLVGNLFMWCGIKKEVNKIPFSSINPLRHLKQELLLFVPYIATLLFSYIDKTMIGYMAINPKRENGYYEQTLKFISIATSIVSSFSTVLTPRMSFYFKENDEKNIKLYSSRGISLIMLLSSLLSCGLFLVGGNVIPWFYGAKYNECILLLKILSIVTLFKGLNAFLGSSILIAAFKQNEYSVSIWVSTIVNIVINYFLIPNLGALGACISSVLAEIFLLLLLLFYTREIFSLQFIMKNITKYLVAYLVVLVSLNTFFSIFTSSIVNSVCLIILTTIFYLLMLIIMKEKYTIQMAEKIKLIFKKMY